MLRQILVVARHQVGHIIDGGGCTIERKTNNSVFYFNCFCKYSLDCKKYFTKTIVSVNTP